MKIPGRAGRFRVDRYHCFAVLGRPDLLHLDAMVREAQKISTAREREANAARKKAFGASNGLGRSRLMLESPFIRFALQRPVVAAADQPRVA